MRTAALLLLTAACVSPVAVETQPAAPPAWTVFAAEALVRGDFAVAEDHAALALKADPHDDVAWALAREACVRRMADEDEARMRALADRWQMMARRVTVHRPAGRPILRRYPIGDLIGWDPRSAAARDVYALLDRVTVDLHFPATPLRDVLESLATASGILVSMRADVSARFGKIEISLVASEVTLKDALQLVLMQASADGAVYYEAVVGGLRLVDGTYPDPPREWSLDLDDLVARLHHACGRATIVRDRRSLVVRAMPPVHDEIAAKLIDWRRRRATESAGSVRRTDRR